MRRDCGRGSALTPWFPMKEAALAVSKEKRAAALFTRPRSLASRLSNEGVNLRPLGGDSPNTKLYASCRPGPGLRNPKTGARGNCGGLTVIRVSLGCRTKRSKSY
jgi:hypothetical protein